ncbi:hypothetical protein WEH80_36650 [Actinomycetes bacterium KLBMP 9759]
MQPFAPPVHVASARDEPAVAGSASPFNTPMVLASAVVAAVHLLLAHCAVASLCDNVAGAPVTGFAASSTAFAAASPACFAASAAAAAFVFCSSVAPGRAAILAACSASCSAFFAFSPACSAAFLFCTATVSATT